MTYSAVRVPAAERAYLIPVVTFDVKRNFTGKDSERTNPDAESANGVSSLFFFSLSSDADSLA